MGKLEDTIYENYRKALEQGDFDQAKKATELGRVIREYVDNNGFKDYSGMKMPASQILGKFFNPLPYTYSPERGTITLDSSVITLTDSENKLFYLFSQNETKGKDIKVITKQQICEHMWDGQPNKPSALRIAIYRLRKKIEPDPDNPQILINLPPKGYIFLGNKLEG